MTYAIWTVLACAVFVFCVACLGSFVAAFAELFRWRNAPVVVTRVTESEAKAARDSYRESYGMAWAKLFDRPAGETGERHVGASPLLARPFSSLEPGKPFDQIQTCLGRLPVSHVGMNVLDEALRQALGQECPAQEPCGASPFEKIIASTLAVFRNPRQPWTAQRPRECRRDDCCGLAIMIGPLTPFVGCAAEGCVRNYGGETDR